MSKASKVVATSWDQALDLLDRAEVTLDGVHGRIKVEHTPWLRVTHEASPRGRRSEPYREMKRKLRDDYDTDLTWSERLVEIMADAGIVFGEEVADAESEGRL